MDCTTHLMKTQEQENCQVVVFVSVWAKPDNSNTYVQERINIHYPTPVVAEVKEEVSEDILDEIMEERMVQVILQGAC